MSIIKLVSGYFMAKDIAYQNTKGRIFMTYMVTKTGNWWIFMGMRNILRLLAPGSVDKLLNLTIISSLLLIIRLGIP